MTFEKRYNSIRMGCEPLARDMRQCCRWPFFFWVCAESEQFQRRGSSHKVKLYLQDLIREVFGVRGSEPNPEFWINGCHLIKQL